MFQKAAWEKYLEEGGKEVAEFFRSNLQGDLTKQYPKRICELHRVYCPAKNISEWMVSRLKELVKDFAAMKAFDVDSCFERFFEDYAEDEVWDEFDDGFDDGFEEYFEDNTEDNTEKNTDNKAEDSELDAFFMAFDYACYPILELKFFEKDSKQELNFKGKIDWIMTTFYTGMQEDHTKRWKAKVYRDKGIFPNFADMLPYYSTFLAKEFPELFVPYYFSCNFNVLQQIAWEFGIALPEPPIAQDYEARICYYGKICNALQKFRKRHRMSPYELCAFLYDFAPKCIGGMESYLIRIQDLPEPKSVFFISGSSQDGKSAEDKNAVLRWDCGTDVKAGDLVVMYLCSPIGAMDSVWRCVSTAHDDPFYYNYRYAFLAAPHKIRRITKKQLQEDDLFREIPIIKKHMQGINGTELSHTAYNHLLDIAGSDLPRLQCSIEDDANGVYTEKDVENKFVRPLLKRLVHWEEEYHNELYVRIGNRGRVLIPGIVVHPTASGGRLSASMLVKVRLSIPSEKALEEAKAQAREYAKLLRARFAVIASKEGFWITKADDDFRGNVFAISWAELKQRGVFPKLEKLLKEGNK